MTLPVDDPRAIIKALEQQAGEGDQMMRALLDQLREIVDAREELEQLAQHQTHMRAARTSFLVEAAILLTERENGCDIVHLSRHRRPKLRVVQ
jgi:hypothetical protein